MAKIALLNDLHYGARNSSDIFASYFSKFYNEVFFPYLDEHNIEHVAVLGDIFDIRKFVGLKTATLADNELFKPLADRKIKTWYIVGNHDIYFRNELHINSIRALYNNRTYEGMTIIDSPTEVEIDSCKILMLPWIASGNLAECKKAIKKTKAQILFSHLELSGFEMYRGQFVEHGETHAEYSKFDSVFSGHFHHKSSRDNIHYLGTQFEITWADYGDQKGFHVFDTETRELEFIHNPFKIFHKVYYDDSKTKSAEELLDKLDVSQYSGCYIKLVVVNKNNPYWFDLFFDALEKSECVNLQIVDETANLYTEMYENSGTIQDTTSMINQYIEGLDLDGDKPKLEALMASLYQEAINLVEEQ